MLDFQGGSKCMDDRKGRCVPRAVELGEGMEVKTVNYPPSQAADHEDWDKKSQG